MVANKALTSVTSVSLTTPSGTLLISSASLLSDKLTISITPAAALPYNTVLSVSVKVLAFGVAGIFSGQFITETDPGTPLIDVHFAVLTSKSAALAFATEAQMRREVDILNTYFKGADGSQPVRFRFKDVVYANQLPANVCAPMVSLGDMKQEYDYTTLMNYYGACADSRVVDQHAINVYVYDSYTVADGYDDITSHGIHNTGHPLVLFDWERLNHTTQSPEEHEFGHVFGLGHVCLPSATLKTSTNIMASSYDGCGGTGGLRNLGFDASQLATIKAKATVIVNALAQ